MLIRFKKQSDVRPSDITPESVYHDRRRFMKTAALAGAGLALGAWPLPSFAARPSLPGPVHPSKWSKENLPNDDTLNSWKDITSYNNFYEFGVYKSDPKDNAGDFTVDPWSIEISGACNKPGKLSYDELMKPTKLEDRVYRHRCVEAWSMVIPWVGVPLASVLKRFEPTGDAKFVAFETIMDPKEMPGQRQQILQWPYKEGLRMDEAMNDLAILAVGLYGKPMPNQNGAPIRLVVPWKYGFKSIKSIVRINFQKEMPPTSWNEASPREYGFYSNVNPHVPHPRWSQAKERRIGEFFKRPTLMFNGYQEEVASLYAGMDLRKNF